MNQPSPKNQKVFPENGWMQGAFESAQRVVKEINEDLS
jgi:hypothetical protein